MQTLARTDHPLWIDGAPVTTGEWKEIRSPWSGESVGRIAVGGAAEAKQAIDAAARVLREAPIAQAERAAILERMASLLRERVEEFAATICAEAGKPISIARGEAERAIGTCQAAAIAAHSLAGAIVPMEGLEAGAGHLGYTVRVPVGVVGAITPFNFPLNLVSHKVAPAIASGCAIVHKPAGQTPLTALLLAQLAADAGLPAGWHSVVSGPAGAIADVLCKDERVRLITFTGSTEVGRLLKTRAPYAEVKLELGNSTPVVVAADADIDAMATAIAPGAFGFAGQTCVSPQRVIVERGAADRVRAALTEATNVLVAGDPADEDTVTGPLINTAEHDRVLAWIEEAVAAGARLLAGGESIGNNTLQPTLLDGVTQEMRVGCDEVFGPVLGITEVDELEAAFDLANATQYGLQAAVFTSSLDTAMRAAQRLDFGGVLVNEAPNFRADHMPYGGTKASGNTKEGPAWAIREMSEERLVVIKLPR